ncbi:guanylate kinase-associated protein mars [Culicoides brevitarsis]|uniref:guanylate kinase-associated protein mars n=1 Tax=Culicoides brevitarsis TaxID=469753 RepID=UPI00307C5625
MERQGLYKNRPAPGQKTRNGRAHETQMRGRANRADAFLENRGLTNDIEDESPVGSPVKQLTMKSVSKMASTMNFTTKTEERLFKMNEIRKMPKRNAPAKKSPFVSVVPCGRILPKKRDILEDKMKEFHERFSKQTATKTPTATKRRSIKRRSIGKTQLVVRKQAGKAVVLKAVTRPKSVKKEPKSASKTLSARKIPIITEPQPSTSKDQPILKMKPRTPNGFIAPTLKNVPKKLSARKIPEIKEPQPGTSKAPNNFLAANMKMQNETQETFNFCQSFITSTTSKRASVRIVPENEFADEESLLEGISPIPDVTPFKFAANKQSPRDSFGKKSMKGLPTPNIFGTEDQKADEKKVKSRKSSIVGLPKPNVEEIQPAMVKKEEPFVFVARKTKSIEKEPSIDEELNITFTQEDDEEEEKPIEENKRRSSIRKSLPVISDPQKIERNPIAKAHEETLESEIKRLTDRNTEWTTLRDNNLLNDNVIGLINSAVGQSELLMRKKLPKFRELIENYEFDSGDRAVLQDDLDGYWMTVMMEIESIDKRFADLEALKANDWEEKLEEVAKPKTRKRTRKAEKVETKTTANLGLLEHIRNLRKKIQKPEKVPEMDTVEAENVQLVSVKRLADTPRKSIAKRRSLNCSGCCTTPSSARKSKSAKKVSTLVTIDSAAKSKRKSKKINFVEAPEEEAIEPTTVESVAHRSILKSSNKRNTKSVLFAESPEKSTRAQKTPRSKNRKVKNVDASFDWNDENSPMMEFGTPIDTPVSNKGRKSQKATPKPTVSHATVSDYEDSPVSALAGNRSRRSTRLFGNMI